MNAWTAACRTQTGSQNEFENIKGERCFWEVSRVEHADGAITGTIQKIVPPIGGALQARDTFYCRKVGSFRIEGDGTVSRAPAFLRIAS